ncbi:unnamed protein product [Paramecium octaurelia]|uniref:Uncharacterized protein n=1 Tax=Paramecium octaurelia TaxID=43137 RepID=A0A8S1T9A8_PAROT|nr:unnamed protein product [Paramecium octaurelia]
MEPLNSQDRTKKRFCQYYLCINVKLIKIQKKYLLFNQGKKGLLKSYVLGQNIQVFMKDKNNLIYLKIIDSSFSQDPKREKLNFFLVNMLSGRCSWWNNFATDLSIFICKEQISYRQLIQSGPVIQQFERLCEEDIQVRWLEGIKQRIENFSFGNHQKFNDEQCWCKIYCCLLHTLYFQYHVIPIQYNQKKNAIAINSNIHYKIILDCAVQILNKKGLKSFFKGALSQSFFESRSALSLVLYDEIKQFLSQGPKLRKGRIGIGRLIQASYILNSSRGIYTPSIRCNNL